MKSTCQFVITQFVEITGNASKVQDYPLCVAVRAVGQEDIAKKTSTNAICCLARTGACASTHQEVIRARACSVRPAAIDIN